MRVTASLSETYVPKWNGNRDLPADEQVSVRLKHPTASEREGLRGYGLGSDHKDIVVKFATDRILRNHVVEINSLEVEVNGKVTAIKSGKDLAETTAMVGGLIQELEGVLTRGDDMTEEEVKNSE